MKPLKPEKLPRQFYTRDLLTVARKLLGKILVTEENGRRISGRIVEVEAYDGSVDEAAHTFRGKTRRNEVMFGEGGFFYVYFTYGAHFCCNVVTGKRGSGTAVLIRAVEPVEGIKYMIKNRTGVSILRNEKEKYNLTSGPGKVCRAFGITREHYGLDLTGSRVFILDQPGIPEEDIVVTRRVGISKSVDLPWRFYIKGNPFVSRK